MRVVAGRVKGHQLRMPKGIETRPTSEKVREAIFSILGAAVENRRVLDLFAGTGAMGIEALSRGASSCVFVERRAPACAVIRTNLAHTRLLTESRVLCLPAERALHLLDEPFGLILLDPPYNYPDLHGIMAMLGEARVIEDDTVVVFEHSPRFTPADRYGRLARERLRVYGDTAVSLLGVREEQSQ
jgi:16S rRNA (guanine(966)-N(2))-methyltransferase RsmD